MLLRVSHIFTLLLTGFVGLCSAFVTYITYSRFDTLAGWTFNGLTLFTVWLFIGHCWQRLADDKSAAPALFQEQPEGV